MKAGLGKTSRHAVVRLLPGDPVLVRSFEHDPTRGEITKKL